MDVATDAEKAYAVKRAQKNHPDLKIETWEDLLSLPLSTATLDTFNELLESDMFDHSATAANFTLTDRYHGKKKTPRKS